LVTHDVPLSSLELQEQSPDRTIRHSPSIV
jgi:hypothetical protein